LLWLLHCGVVVANAMSMLTWLLFLLSVWHVKMGVWKSQVLWLWMLAHHINLMVVSHCKSE
jgi:hypothetical protein